MIDLLNLYDRAVRALGAAGDDATIYRTMLSALISNRQAAREYRSDFTGTRYAVASS